MVVVVFPQYRAEWLGNQGQCEPRAESTSLLDGYAEAKPALNEVKGSGQ